MIKLTTLLGALSALFLANCSNASDTADCSNGKCDFGAGGCEFLVDKSKSEDGTDAVELSSLNLNDKFANLVLKPGAADDTVCPATFPEVMEVLTKSCGGEAGKVMIASETNQLEDDWADPAHPHYRAVIAQPCQGDPAELMQFLVVGKSTPLDNANDLPNDFHEIIAWDEEAKVFNFYAANFAENQWEFHGTTHDVVASYDPNVPIEEVENACARCHTGGGMVMKEFDTPWVHWEGHEDIIGAADLAAKFPNTTKASGLDMERFTNNANEKLKPHRAEHLSQGTVEAMLEPLFCNVKLNIDTATDFAGDAVDDVENHAILDELLRNPFGREVSMGATYETAIADTFQVIAEDDNSSPEWVSFGQATDRVDTIFKFAYLHRARSETNYIKELVDRNLIDRDFMMDALMVDFTNPVLSQDRCQLLAHAPASASSPSEIRDGFITNLQAKGSARSAAESEFLSNLESQGDESVHEGRLDNFMNACKANPDFGTDLVKVTSARRQLAKRAFAAFRYDGTLPVDSLYDNGDTSDAELRRASAMTETCKAP